MFQLFLIFCLLFLCKAEFYQDEPMGHFMEYSLEMPSSSSHSSSPPHSSSNEPTMYMRYGNIDKSGRYLRNLEIARPTYPSYSPAGYRNDDDDAMPPFPFALPYQYISNKRYPKPPIFHHHQQQRQPWNPEQHQQQYPSQNSWGNGYNNAENNFREQAYEPEYFDESPPPRHPYSGAAPRFSSTVDEIQNRVFSMMHNIGGGFPPPSSFSHSRPGKGHHSGYSRESQFGYQMYI